MPAPPGYSIITTCKGRLHHLLRSLPALLRQADAEVIVVDYNCPDGTADRVATDFPEARVVRERSDPGFNPSRARNLGAAAATGERLAFIDADIVLRDDFLAAVNTRLGAGQYAKFPEPAVPRDNSMQGTCIVPRQDFRDVGGYDELLRDYGGEDLELYDRLGEAGLQKVFLDPATVSEVIEHDPAERARFFEKDAGTGFLVGKVYRIAKGSLIRMNGSFQIEPQILAGLYKEIVRLVGNMEKSGNPSLRLEMKFPDTGTRGLHQRWTFDRMVVVEVSRKSGK